VTVETETDESGVWQVLDGVRLLVEPSQEWLDRRAAEPPEPDPEPTIAELQAQIEALLDALGGD
jgi:hypothetical protein